MLQALYCHKDTQLRVMYIQVGEIHMPCVWRLVSPNGIDLIAHTKFVQSNFLFYTQELR